MGWHDVAKSNVLRDEGFRKGETITPLSKSPTKVRSRKLVDHLLKEEVKRRIRELLLM